MALWPAGIERPSTVSSIACYFAYKDVWEVEPMMWTTLLNFEVPSWHSKADIWNWFAACEAIKQRNKEHTIFVYVDKHTALTSSVSRGKYFVCAKEYYGLNCRKKIVEIK